LSSEIATAFWNTPGAFLAVIRQGGIWSMIVLLILLLMSVVSWGLIIRKSISLHSQQKASGRFLKNLRLEEGLEGIHYRSVLYPKSHSSVLFLALYEELEGGIRGEKISFWNTDQKSKEEIERIIDKTILSQKLLFDKDLNILATISSSAPFIGLLGTVTGIIDSFYSIAAKGASTIAVVAPGISAALVATALGLFTAIPALIAFNLFREKSRVFSNEMMRFGLELTPLFLRGLAAQRSARKTRLETVRRPEAKKTNRSNPRAHTDR